MQSLARSGRHDVLEALRRRGIATATDIARDIGKNTSTVFRHLREMELEGVVDRQVRNNAIEYEPNERIDVDAMVRMPGADPANPHFHHFSWTSNGPLDWRFPLTGQIADEDGQYAALQLLTDMHTRGLFTPWLYRQLHAHGQGVGVGSDAGETIWTEHARAHQGFTIGAYGSCVRGDARDDSDLDLIVIGPGAAHEQRLRELYGSLFVEIDWASKVSDLANTTNLVTKRPIDLHYFSYDELGTRPPTRFRRAMHETLVTIYSDPNPGRLIEDLLEPDDE